MYQLTISGGFLRNTHEFRGGAGIYKTGTLSLTTSRVISNTNEADEAMGDGINNVFGLVSLFDFLITNNSITGRDGG